MTLRETIETGFDFRTDTPPGRDPDTFSPTLSACHRQLWSKRLPSGARFDLTVSGPPYYLHHASDAGEFRLSSDGTVPTFATSVAMAHVVAQIPKDEIAAFVRVTFTMGGTMVYPANRVDGHMTINGARGCQRLIRDRFDLTVECIRRHYRGELSPLTDTLARYASFFRLFEDFAGYVDFFLLQDLVDERLAVRFFAPFDDFASSPFPQTIESYLAYRSKALTFLEARNKRMAACVEGSSTA